MSFTKLLSRLTSSRMEPKVAHDNILDKDNSLSIETRKNDKSNNNNDKDTSPNGSGVSGGNKAVSGRRRFGENGFEEQGGYMAAKKAKLDNQFNSSVRVLNADSAGSSSSDPHNIFHGLSVHINGYTNPPEPELRELFIRHGGTFHPYHSQTNTTYVIATNLSAPSKRLYGSKTVKPDWIMDSIAAGHALETRPYMLYNLNEEKLQTSLSRFIRPKESLDTKTNNTNYVPTSLATESREEAIVHDVSSENGYNNGNNSIVNGILSDDEEFFECSQEGISLSPVKLISGESISNKELNSTSALPNANSVDVLSNNYNQSNNSENSVLNTSIVSPNKSGKVKTATDEGFIEDFFGRSRLHLISEQKKEMQIFIGNLRKQAGIFPNLKKFKTEIESRGVGFFSGDSSLVSEQVLMHIDLDCFFVSVGLLSRPHLRGKPVAVTHSTGKTQESRSDIACASYEARKFGVRNGMWVGEAREKCPNLEVIPYDFDEYRRVSKKFFEAVSTFTLDIEPNSVDEMVVDVTSILKTVTGATPEDLALFIRKVILDQTKCPASIGIGSNKLLAKLAVKLAKPDGVHYLKDCDAPSYILTLNVRDLPGIGWSNESKLRESFKVETCSELLQVPLQSLKTVFGEKTAEKMHSLCKGIDATEVKIGVDRPKSVSVDVNFGIRFQKEEDVTNFLVEICKELSNRAEKIEATSNNFTLKLLIRRKGAGEPLKQGGHGIVDCITRSRKLMNPTRNWQELYRTACSLIRVMRFPPTDYRGVGVTLTDLAFDYDKTNKKSVQRTLTEMPISHRAQKMLSLSQKKNKVLSIANKTPGSDLIPSDSALKDIDNNKAPNNNSDLPSDTASSDNVEVIPLANATLSDVHQIEAPVSNLQPPPTEVDINILRQLPREIAEEQCHIYGIDKALLDKMNEPMLNSSKTPAIANGNITNLVIDDQQPCSSRQAIERQQEQHKQQRNLKETSLGKRHLEEFQEDVEPAANDPLILEEQITPVLQYSNEKRSKSSRTIVHAKDFWNDDVDGMLVPPVKISMPALNNLTDITEIRNLIRQGLETVTDPTEDDVTSLENYFRELILNCWLQQASILLKFLYRQIQIMPQDSNWRPFLVKIIRDSQNLCEDMYSGPIILDE